MAEVDEYLETFGERAYEQCRNDSRAAMLEGDRGRSKFLGAVRKVLAKKFNRDRRLDTATRYLEPQTPYDAGPGYVVHRPDNATLH